MTNEQTTTRKPKFAMDYFESIRVGQRFAFDEKTEADLLDHVEAIGYPRRSITARRCMKAYREQVARG